MPWSSGLYLDFFEEQLHHFLDAMVPVHVRGIGSAAACVLYALREVMLEVAAWTPTSGLERVPYIATMTLPVGPIVGFPLAFWTLDFYFRHRPNPKVVKQY